jgi:hypothetical protein
MGRAVFEATPASPRELKHAVCVLLEVFQLRNDFSGFFGIMGRAKTQVQGTGKNDEQGY